VIKKREGTGDLVMTFGGVFMVKEEKKKKTKMGNSEKNRGLRLCRDIKKLFILTGP